MDLMLRALCVLFWGSIWVSIEEIKWTPKGLNLFGRMFCIQRVNVLLLNWVNTRLVWYDSINCLSKNNHCDLSME